MTARVAAGVAALALTSCYRSPNVLTRTEAADAGFGVRTVLFPYQLLRDLAPAPVGHWAGQSPRSLDGMQEALELDVGGCAAASVVCGDGPDGALCAVRIPTTCTGATNGTYSITATDTRLSVCWGADGLGDLAPLDVGDGFVWGWSDFRAGGVGPFEVEHQLFWSTTPPTSTDVAAACVPGARAYVPEIAHAVTGTARLLFTASGLYFEGGDLAWLQPLVLYDPMFAPEPESDRETCTADGCPSWALRPEDLLLPTNSFARGGVSVDFTSPEPDHAELWFTEDGGFDATWRGRAYTIPPEAP